MKRTRPDKRKPAPDTYKPLRRKLSGDKLWAERSERGPQPDTDGFVFKSPADWSKS